MMMAAVSMGAALTYHPGKDKEKPSTESSPNGKGPPLDFLDRVSRGISITGALAQGDTSGNLKDPNGSRYGIPNGKNPGGPNLWALQVGVSLFVVVQNPVKTTKDFVELIRRGLAKGEAVIFSNPKHFTKDLAEKLAATPEKKLTQENLEAAESFGESMAPSLNHSRTIMPYSRAKVFTKGWKQEVLPRVKTKMKTKIWITFRAENMPGEGATILEATGCGSDVATTDIYTAFGPRKVEVDVKLDETDPRVAKLLALLSQHGVEVESHLYDEYSEEDRQQARLLVVGPVRYGEEVTIAPWAGTKYDLTTECPNCETGAKQKSPAYISYFNKKILRKHRALLASYYSLIVDGGMRKKLVDAGVTGISFGDVRMRLENDKWSEVARDQVFATHTFPPMRVELTPEIEKQICMVCRRGGWQGLADPPYREEDLVGMQDFNLTWEWFGEFQPENRAKDRPVSNAYPRLLVTPKVMNIFREAGVKAFRWTPVNVAP